VVGARRSCSGRGRRDPWSELGVARLAARSVARRGSLDADGWNPLLDLDSELLFLEALIHRIWRLDLTEQGSIRKHGKIMPCMPDINIFIISLISFLAWHLLHVTVM